LSQDTIGQIGNRDSQIDFVKGTEFFPLAQIPIVAAGGQNKSPGNGMAGQGGNSGFGEGIQVQTELVKGLKKHPKLVGCLLKKLWDIKTHGKEFFIGAGNDQGSYFPVSPDLLKMQGQFLDHCSIQGIGHPPI
jgi:hypothetical protein